MYLKCSFRTISESSLNAAWSESINNIPSQPEWHRLRGRQDFALFKCNTQVNVDDLGGVLINQNILDMPVSESEYVPYHGG